MSLLDVLKTPAARVPAQPEGSPEIIDIPDPSEVVIPLEYPERILFIPLVQAGDEVSANQVIGRSEMGNCIHASIGGKVKEIRKIWSARGHNVPAIVIESGTPTPLAPAETLARCNLDLESATRIDLLKAGGVISPWTTPGREHCEDDIAEYPEISHIVIKAVHEETTICNWENLLRENVEICLDGLKRVAEMVPRAKIILLVSHRIESWARSTFGDKAEIVGLSDQYRHRIERIVVPKLTGEEIPASLPYRSKGVGVLSVENALAALAALAGKPFTRKTVTISGAGLEKPVTIRAPIGTRIGDLLASQGLEIPEGGRVLAGGPMKGSAQYTEETPLTKLQHGIHLMTADQLPSEVNLTCINCGKCTRACPVNLQVHMIGRYVEYDMLADANDRHPEACIECGLCAFVCPSHRPLVQLMQMAKKYGG